LHFNEEHFMSLNFDSLFVGDVPDGGRVAPVKRGKYDFAVAYPDPVSLPNEHIVESVAEALAENGSDLAIYPHPQGNTLLRQYVAEKLSRDRDINAGVDDIILGNGSGHPIELLCRVLINPGDVVITDDFVYGGTLNNLRKQFADIRGVQSDASGMDPEALDATITEAKSQGKKPKFVYLIATFQNPQGWTLSEARRKEILAVTQKHEVPILEDDCYADNRYDGESVTSIFNLDDTDSVMYVGSFSKIISPGMSLGYMTAPPSVLDKVMGIKTGQRVSEFTALVVEKYSRKYLDSHIEKINGIQRGKRDAMLSAIGENFGTSAEWSNPDGGLYIWMKLKDGVDMVALHKKALDEIDVGVHPGSNYSPDGVSGKNYLRLCFGYNDSDEIQTGISLLSDFLTKEGALD